MSEKKPLKLTEEELKSSLATLTDWQMEGKGKSRVIAREFRFKDFVTAMGFVNRLAAAAESAGHHPDIDIRYNRVRLALTTHDAGGITARDVKLAGTANGLA